MSDASPALVPGLDGRDPLDAGIQAATRALLARQQPDGHFVFELEADATIPAEYVLLRHYLAEPVDTALEQKIAVYLRRIQGAHGGWPLFRDGDFDMSASVKAYFALKMIGDAPDAAHMRRAREAILARGGAGRTNVFTRLMLALFGFIPWRALPMMPVEIMLLPRWFPFHIDKMSYWSRTVIVPLLVLMALQAHGAQPQGRADRRVVPGAARGAAPRPQGAAAEMGLVPVLPRRRRGAARARAALSQEHAPARHRPRARLRDRAPQRRGRARRHLPGHGQQRDDARRAGLPAYDPLRAVARKSVEKLLVVHAHEAYCQPCVSPVWDTALVCQTLLEVGGDAAAAPTRRGLDWLAGKQVLDVAGDWSVRRPQLRPGGWAFQYANPHYPDVDDTAVVVMAMDREQRLGRHDAFAPAIARAREWIAGMQSRNGGWGAFDSENEYDYLNNIPFADHGALLDPPTEDVTARCLSMLAQLGEKPADAAPKRALDYLRKTQLPDGSWYGRWGMNYIYGTWSVLCALNAAGLDHGAPEIRKAVDWLLAIQNPDGGWGEDGASYKLDYRGYEAAPSTASQTAWALIGLMAAGEAGRPAVQSGIDYLLRHQGADGFWDEPRYTATGFPRVFYLRYHGYPKFFPLWALARYRSLKSQDSPVMYGM